MTPYGVISVLRTSRAAPRRRAAPGTRRAIRFLPRGAGGRRGVRRAARGRPRRIFLLPVASFRQPRQTRCPSIHGEGRPAARGGLPPSSSLPPVPRQGPGPEKQERKEKNERQEGSASSSRRRRRPDGAGPRPQYVLDAPRRRYSSRLCLRLVLLVLLLLAAAVVLSTPHQKPTASLLRLSFFLFLSLLVGQSIGQTKTTTQTRATPPPPLSARPKQRQ
jgi:hypothetical protein